MKELKEKLNGVLSEEEITSLVESFDKAVQERAELMLEEKQKTILEESEKSLSEKLVEATSKIAEEKAAELEEKISALEEKVLDKLNVFIDEVINETFKEDLIKKYAVNECNEPIVKAVFKALEENYVAPDTQGHALLAEAKVELVNIKNQLDEQIAKNLEICEAVEQMKTDKLLSEKTEGLSEEVKKRVFGMFEGKSFGEIESKVDLFLEMIDTKKEKTLGIITEEEKIVESVIVKPSVVDPIKAAAKSFI